MESSRGLSGIKQSGVGPDHQSGQSGQTASRASRAVGGSPYISARVARGNIFSRFASFRALAF